MDIKNNTFQSVTSIITALNSETKMLILYTVKFVKEKMNVNRIVELTKLERTNVSKQLKDLVEIGVFKTEKNGRERIYSFDKSLSKEKVRMIDSILKAYVECECSNGKLPKV